VLAACYLLPTVCMPCKRPAASIRVGRAALHHLPSGGGGGRFLGRQKGARPPLGLEHTPHPPHPVCLSCVVAHVSWLQARLCASRRALTAAPRPPASPTLPPLPPLPLPPLPPLPLLPLPPSSALVCVPAPRTGLIGIHLGPRGWWRLVLVHVHAATDPPGRQGGSCRVGPGQADTHGHAGGLGRPRQHILAAIVSLRVCCS